MAVVNLKPVVASKPARPTRAAIAALKKDPSLAPDFDQKYGGGAAAMHLGQTVELTEMMAELLEQQAELIAKIEEMIDVMKAPRQAIMDQDGNVVGAVPMTKYRLDEDANEWVCAQCGRPQGTCVCDAGGDGDLLKA